MKLDIDPRLPNESSLDRLVIRLYDLQRKFAQANNTRADGFCHAAVSVSASYTMQTGDSVVFCNASGGARTITLPAPAETVGKLMAFRKTEGSANAVTLSPASGQINGAASINLTAAAPGATVASDGSNYFIV